MIHTRAPSAAIAFPFANWLTVPSPPEPPGDGGESNIGCCVNTRCHAPPVRWNTKSWLTFDPLTAHPSARDVAATDATSGNGPADGVDPAPVTSLRHAPLSRRRNVMPDPPANPYKPFASMPNATDVSVAFVTPADTSARHVPPGARCRIKPLPPTAYPVPSAATASADNCGLNGFPLWSSGGPYTCHPVARL